MIKKTVSLIIAVSFIFTAWGCNSSNNSQTEATGSGRYIESQLSVNGQPTISEELFMQGDDIVFIDSWNAKKYTMETGSDTFKISDLPFISELGNKVAVTCISGSRDGAYILGYYCMDDETTKDILLYAYISHDGTVTRLDLDILSEVKYFDFSDDGRVFAGGYGGDIYQVNIKDGSVKRLFSLSGELKTFDIASDYIIACSTSEILLFDLKTNQTKETPEALKQFYKDQKLTVSDPVYRCNPCDFYTGTDNSFYIVSKNGLYRYVMDGNQVEQLLDGPSYHLGNPAYIVRSVMPVSENSFLVNYIEGDVMCYSFDPAASNKITSSLKVYSLKENDTLSQVISEYKITNPNVKIEHETGMASGDSITFEDAVKNLNTEILSDNAPDLIMFDDINVSNYINKKMLLELSEYEDKIDPENVLLDNIAKNYTDGGLYTITCKFGLPVMIASKENLSKITDLSSFADLIETQQKKVPGKPVASLFTEKEVLETALYFIGNSLITDDKINTEKIKEVLEECCRIYKCQHDACSEDKINNHIDNKESADDYNWQFGVPGLSLSMLNNDNLITCGPSTGFLWDLNIITSLEDVNKNIQYRYGFTDNSSFYVPECIFGVCSSGKNKDNAVEFINSAVSQNVQSVELHDGFPVNCQALKSFYNRHTYDNGNNVGSADPDTNEDLFVKAHWLDDAESDRFQKAVEKLDTPIQIDTMTKDVLMDIGTQCLNGSLSVDQSVKKISETLNLKIQE